jgi:hypothetical protein
MSYLSWHNLHMLVWIALVGAISFTISYILVRRMKLS